MFAVYGTDCFFGSVENVVEILQKYSSICNTEAVVDATDIISTGFCTMSKSFTATEFSEIYFCWNLVQLKLDLSRFKMTLRF